MSGTRKLTLDLNGHTLAPNKGSGYVYGLRVMNSAELTVVNSKSTGGIKPVGDYTIGINVSHNAKLTVKGITIEAGVYGITGNGSKPNEEATTIVVDNCVIHATSPVQAIGIYHPQSGELTIKGGGEITGYTGIEMRGGNLTIEEGATVKIAGDYTYNGNYYGFASAPGGNGSVTYGLGVAIVPHTNRTIRVDIAGGTLEGWFALYEHNLMSPPGSVTLNVTGGEFKNIDREAQADSNRPFNATTEGFTSAAVKSVDCAGFISGGTFSTNVSDYLNAVTVQDSDGKVRPRTADDSDAVAQIGNFVYADLQTALTDAYYYGDDKVTLLADIEDTAALGGQYPFLIIWQGAKELTFDLNGHSIGGSGSQTLTVMGTATIKNGTIANSKSGGVAVVAQASAITIENAKITSSASVALQLGAQAEGYWGAAVVKGNSEIDGQVAGIFVLGSEKNNTPTGETKSVLTVEGGSTVKGTIGIGGNGTWDNTRITVNDATVIGGEVGIYHPQQGTLIINNGAKISGNVGIQMGGGELTVNGGEITSTDTAERVAPFKNADQKDGTVVDGAALSVVSRSGYGDVKATVLSGTFTTGNAQNPAVRMYGYAKDSDGWHVLDEMPTNASTAISGGTFSSDVSAYVVEGSQANEETDGVWTIGPVDGSVAAIGIKGYPTLDAAFDALNAMPGSETVTMTILPGIHTPEAARKLLVTRDNVVIQGAGQYDTVINCKAIDVDGQAGVYIGASNVTLKDMTITTSGKNLDAVKVSYTNAAETQPLLKDIVLENLMLTSAAGHGLNLHGVDGVAVTNVKATGGKCGLSLANAKNVTVSDSALEGEWGSVGMMYKAENPNGTYNNPVELTLAGTNKLTGKIYSERPAHADTVTLAAAQTADVYGAKVANSEQLTTTLSAKIVDSEGKAAYYATLPAAVADAQAGDTVTLLQPVTITEQLLIATSDITLDGNGKTITADGAFHGIQVYCADNVTLKDLTVTGAGKSGLLVNASAVTVEGKLDLTGNSWDGLLNVGYGQNITGSHTTSLTFADGAALTGVTTVYSDAGDVSRAGENTITIGAVPGLVQVKGSADMPNCWTTAANAEAAAEAKTGDTYYAALQAAVDAAAADDTVTLLKPVTLDAPMGNPAYTSAILITKNLTLDGNGKTITVDGKLHGIQVSGNVAVTIKDLTVTGAGKDALLVNNGSNVTVDGLTTSDNAWGAINVDHGSTLDFQSGSLSESTKIWTEDFENCHITAAGLVEVHDLPNEDGKVHFLPETDARVIAKVGSVY